MAGVLRSGKKRFEPPYCAIAWFFLFLAGLALDRSHRVPGWPESDNGWDWLADFSAIASLVAAGIGLTKISLLVVRHRSVSFSMARSILCFSLYLLAIAAVVYAGLYG